MALAVLICIAALLLDRAWGEPRRWHPLVGLGNCASRLEARLNARGQGSVAAGALACLLVAAPWLLLAIAAGFLPFYLWLPISVVILWLCIGYRSLLEHAEAVQQALLAGDIDQARTQLARIVSRNTEALDETGIATATTESLLENGADAVFASLFWFVVAGLPGVVLHRVVNTLDAMWGYRNERFNRFGRVAARLDDILNWIPARLTALSYALAGDSRRGLQCWFRQARHWDSPNAGPVMAAGAGALGLLIGGRARYGDQWKERPALGDGEPATAASIVGASSLIGRALLIWIGAGLAILLLAQWIL